MTQKHSEGKMASSLQFFFYLLTFFSLAFVSFGFAAIVFQFINKFFPDVLIMQMQGSYDQGAIKFGIASLIVAAPLYFLMMRNIILNLRSGKIAKESAVRKWLTYIVLFITAVIVIGDLIAVIFNFLSGDIAIRFILQMLTIFLIAGSIFGYYFWDIRKKHTTKVIYPLDLLAARVAIALITIVFFGSFFIIDKPSVARAKKVDQQTVEDLRMTDSSVREYFFRTNKLPESLDDLKQTGYGVFLRKESALEYKKTGDNSFSLCANFNLPNTMDVNKFEVALNEWTHDSGRVCFDRIALKQEGIEIKR